MKRPTNKELELSIAEIDALLLAEGVEVNKVDDVISVDEGLEIAGVLNERLRPFIIQYTAILNRSKTAIPVPTEKLAGYIEQAEKLSNTAEIILSCMGTAYLHAIKLITNGFDDIEDTVFELYVTIKLTELDELKRLLTYVESSGAIGVTVDKDEDAE